jgi:hypothetical protein
MSGTPVDTNELQKLKWPTSARDVPPTDIVPLNTLLQALQFLASDQDRKTATAATSWDADTPASMQVIKSGALQITQTGTKVIAGFGGGAALLSAVAATISGFASDVGEPITVTLIASAAVLLSSVAIALALFVKGDLEARGLATAARHRGRAEIAAMFLQTTAALPAAAAPSSGPRSASLPDDFLFAAGAFPKGIRVATTEWSELVSVDAMRRTGIDRALELRLHNGDWVDVGQVIKFVTGGY